MENDIHVLYQKGNDIHDRANGGHPMHFSVSEAVAHLSNRSFHGITVENSFDVEFIHTNPAVPQSPLFAKGCPITRQSHYYYYWHVLGFVGKANIILLMDHHLNENYRALFGKSGLQDFKEFLVNAENCMSPIFNLCLVTFVKYA